VAADCSPLRKCYRQRLHEPAKPSTAGTATKLLLERGHHETPPDGNLIGGTTFATSFDPKLGPLADNGGEIMPDGNHRPTHALLPGSAAIDAGDPGATAGVDNTPDHDRRGRVPFTRVFGLRIDIGTFELRPTDALAADYNLNGMVDAGDYTIWRSTRGDDVPPGSGADGNFDGRIDQLGFNVGRNSFGVATTM
jgi:hypothetical protein